MIQMIVLSISTQLENMSNHSSLHDAGLTGRKLTVDSFGAGAQSSKDYTKVDRSGLVNTWS